MACELSKFRDRCSYCYAGLREGLSWCTCNLSLCNNHNVMHHNKFGCRELFTVKENDSGELSVEITPTDSTTDEVLTPDRILQDIEKENRRNSSDPNNCLTECPHASGVVPVEKTLLEPKCSVCGIGENLWLCLECGNVGCGREQPGKKGSSHALAHFNDQKGLQAKHSQAVYISSIGKDLTPDIYCYECDSFILFPTNLKIKYDNPNPQKFNDNGKENKDNEPFIRKDQHFIGIKNAGETCYISSVLQMLASIYDDCDSLCTHFELCDMNPLECFCCQFTRITSTICRIKQDEMSGISASLDFLEIGDFLRIIFTEMPQYVRGQQQDSAEFLQNILLRISFYEDAGLIAPITGDLNFAVETVLDCQGCGHSNKTTTEDKILYVSHENSLDSAVQKHFDKTSLRCECGNLLSVQNILVKLPKILIISIKTYKMENNELVKITDPIDAGSVLLGPIHKTKQKYAVQNCIVHTGSSLHCGHYTWWTRFGGEYIFLNDRNVEESSKEGLQNGVIFMLRHQ